MEPITATPTAAAQPQTKKIPPKKMDRWDCLMEVVRAGFAITPLDGKKPIRPRWEHTAYELNPDPDEFSGNYGVVLTDDFLVIDIDPKNFAPNDKPHVRLFAEIEASLKELNPPIVRTGSGGLHIYFRKPANVAVKFSLRGYKGIDFKGGRGHQVVGPGSLHPNTQKPYEIFSGSFGFIPDCPARLLSLLEKTESAATAEKSTTEAEKPKRKYFDSDADIVRFKQFLENAPAAIEGQNGDRTTYTVACQGFNFGLSPSKTLELMLAHYNHRCSPPWDINELKIKIENAYKYATGELGGDSPLAQFAEVTVSGEKISHVVRWDRTEGGALKSSIQNCVNFFIMESSEIYKSIAFNEFQGQVYIIKELPWHRGVPLPEGGLPWSDNDSVQCRFYLNHRYGFDPKTSLIDEAVLAAASFQTFHPVRDFLKSLKWDGGKRLDNWLTQYAGVADSAYAREIGKKVLVQAVARVFYPGTKVDNVLILEGPQGVGKSTLVSVLGGKWYADIVVDPHGRDTVDAMLGKWIIEFSEMEVTRRADVQALKAFITRQTDRVRLAYGKRSIDYPRQCIFMGTINPDATQEYFIDSTGNRRFWPVVCGTIRTDLLRRDRDQLFAEAVQCYLRGESLHVENTAVLRDLKREQDFRQVTDPWTDAIVEFLGTNEFVKAYGFCTTRDIWELGLRGNVALLSRPISVRIAAIMRRLGWEYNTFTHPTTCVRLKAFRLPGVKPPSPTESLAEGLTDQEKEIFS